MTDNKLKLVGKFIEWQGFTWYCDGWKPTRKDTSLLTNFGRTNVKRK